jgi:hypothetical protein
MKYDCSRTSINRIGWLDIGKWAVNEVPHKTYNHVTISSTSPKKITTNISKEDSGRLLFDVSSGGQFHTFRRYIRLSF